jgi:hypothetical protein
MIAFRARRSHLRIAFAKAFAAPSGWIAASVGAAFVLLLTALLPSLKLIGFTFGASEFPLALKLRTAAEVLWNGRIVFAHPGGWLAFPLAALFGANAALVYAYMREQVALRHPAGASAVGIVIGLLGVGCAACGSVVLTSLLGVGFVAALPFGGRELAWLGLAIMIFALFDIVEKIADPSCRIPARKS